MSREQRQKYKCDMANKLHVSVTKINNWINGRTIPNLLEQKTINIFLKQKIF